MKKLVGYLIRQNYVSQQYPRLIFFIKVKLKYCCIFVNTDSNHSGLLYLGQALTISAYGGVPKVHFVSKKTFSET